MNLPKSLLFMRSRLADVMGFGMSSFMALRGGALMLSASNRMLGECSPPLSTGSTAETRRSSLSSFKDSSTSSGTKLSSLNVSSTSTG